MPGWVIGMRDAFSQQIYERAKTDDRVILVTSDTGAICHDKVRYELSNQYLNVGIAEQNMVGVGAGMALGGKIPFVYAIATFSALRCYEQTRVDICCIGLPVTVVGVGAGFDYNTLGPTHHSVEDLAVMRVLPNMTVFSPSDSLMAEQVVDYCIDEPGPKYVRLDRTGIPLVYKAGQKLDLKQGMTVLREGKDVCIFATGRMVLRALELAKELEKHSVSVGVIDFYKIAPVNSDLLCDIVGKYKHIASLEEHFVTGGIGSAILETLSDAGIGRPVFRFGIPDKYCRIYGPREYLLKENGLDLETLTRNLLKKINQKDAKLEVGV